MKLQRIYSDTSVIGGCFDSDSPIAQRQSFLVEQFSERIYYSVAARETSTDAPMALNWLVVFQDFSTDILMRVLAPLVYIL